MLFIIALALLVFAGHASTGSNANDERTTKQVISSNDNDDNANPSPDFDDDETVGISDFLLFVDVFGLRQGDEGYDARFDLDGDGVIGIGDFLIFVNNFGKEIPSAVVAIPDANLRAAIEAALGKASGAPITEAKMKTLTHLTASNADISDLTGLEAAINLTTLALTEDDITDISPLSGLTNLTFLDLANNDITDISPLSGLTNLRTLELRGNPLSASSINDHIPALESRGATVQYDLPDNAVFAIPDANLQAAIEAALGKASGATITEAEMKTLTHLTASNADISDLTGLEAATNLTLLALTNNDITDISALSGLTNLKRLYLNGNNITDISPLSGLTNLTNLTLTENDITDISALSELTNLKILELRGNPLSASSINDHIRVLKSRGTTVQYDLPGNEVVSIPDANLRAAINAALGHSSGATITEAEMKTLTHLTTASNADISDLTGLEAATNLTNLALTNNDITDISALSGLTNLQIIRLAANDITDISPLSGLTNLIVLNLGRNDITDISPLAGLTKLETLELKYNNITDISPLAGLTRLRKLELKYNNITDISPLAGLTRRTTLDLWGNPLSASSINDHIRVLESRGATVLYSPLRESDFDIELVFLGSFTERQKRMLHRATRRWMSIIIDDLPDYEFTQGWSGQCGDHSIEIPPGERIDDLRIYVASFEGDAAVGWARPDILREETHLPVVGCMAFDLKRGYLPVVGPHEIGHVLGFGSLWRRFGFYQNPSRVDQHFNGPLAIAAFNEAGGRDYRGAKVPVAGGHWRGEVFGSELMRSIGGSALSAITVQSLADLGYGVDVTQADPYILPSARASSKIAAPLPSIPGMDVTQTDIYTQCGAGLSREPIYVVDPQGRVIRTIDR